MIVFVERIYIGLMPGGPQVECLRVNVVVGAGIEVAATNPNA